MTVQSRSALKAYFLTGATPTESNFGDLIDSTLLVGDVVSSFSSDSTILPLSASAGKTLNDSVTGIESRVALLEDAENQFGSGYYTKSEVDSRISDVDAVIESLPYAGQITNLGNEIDSLESLLNSKADLVHTQDMVTINGLSGALDEKANTADLEFVRDQLIDSINAIPGGVNQTTEIAALQSSVDSLSNSYEVLATKIELDGKADINHAHAIEELTGIEDYYNKASVDALISQVVVGEHTHNATDITGLGDEIQSKTNLLVSDHSALTNNPHGVTKEQIGLGNVSNLSPEDMVNAAGVATSADLDVVVSALASHEAETDNPHSVTKDQVGLSNVPNVDVQQLLNDHLSADNPHNIDINFFDIYTTAQTDSRIQTQIDAKLGYEFTPLTNDESAGEIADIAYDSGNIYLKTGSSTWLKSPLYPVWTERPAKQADVDAGNATTVGEVIAVNEPPKSGGSPELFGFIRDENGDLVVVTTDGGVADIDNETYSKFREEIWGNTGFSFQIINGDLISIT